MGRALALRRRGSVSFMALAFQARPLTPGSWADMEALFDLPGGSIVRGCWCMFYRRSGKVSVTGTAAADNKRQLWELVGTGVVPGLVGYVDKVGRLDQPWPARRPRKAPAVSDHETGG